MIPQVRPAVVLMDMRMPAMSGLEALQALARINQLPQTIILTPTNYPNHGLYGRGRRCSLSGSRLDDAGLQHCDSGEVQKSARRQAADISRR